MAFLGNYPVTTAIIAVAIGWLVKGFFTVLQSRRRFKNLPGPPHHPIFGHLIAVGKIIPKIPKRVHPHVQPHYLTQEFNLPPVYYMDLWPVTDPLLVILDPETAQEVATTRLGKDHKLTKALEPLAGKDNMVTMDGAVWKKWRTVFNPAFSVQQLMSQVPTIVNCAEGLVTILDDHAQKNRLFRLEEEATKFTLDIIGIVVCDHDFKSLTTENEFVETMRKTLTWMPDTQSLNLFHKYHPLRPLYWKYYKWQMDKYIGRVLDERFAVRDASVPKNARKKVGIDLALEEYFKEHGQDVDSRNVTMDAEFRRYAIDNLLALLFAGHDTTASTLCYCYHLLSKHPDKLAKVRQELDDVFGAGVGAGEKLRQDPYLINKCEYTFAVIKETLRLWSPASTIRTGAPDYFIKDPVTGDMLPTDGMTIWIAALSIHRDTRSWGETAPLFMPERFLAENADQLKPHAWRPFEKGPRNCVGQELALLELKIILAMTVREYDVTAAYDELESLDNDGSMWTQARTPRDGPQEVFGDTMYQILLAAAKPRDGMPARIKRRDMKAST